MQRFQRAKITKACRPLEKVNASLHVHSNTVGQASRERMHVCLIESSSDFVFVCRNLRLAATEKTREEGVIFNFDFTQKPNSILVSSTALDSE